MISKTANKNWYAQVCMNSLWSILLLANSSSSETLATQLQAVIMPYAEDFFFPFNIHTTKLHQDVDQCLIFQVKLKHREWLQN